MTNTVNETGNKTLTDDEIRGLVAALKDKVAKYVLLDDDEAYSEKGGVLSENIYAITNSFLDTSDNRGLTELEKILGEYISSQDLGSFDLLHMVMIELMTSGYTDDEKSTPYTLVWLAATQFNRKSLGEDEINFENFETVIQASFFDAQITSAMDDLIITPQALPTDFRNNVTIKDVFDFTSQHFANVGSARFNNSVFQSKGSEKMKKSLMPTFYIPVFIKGTFGDVIEAIYDKDAEVLDALERNSNLILGEGSVLFHCPVGWVDATEDGAEKMLNTGKMGAFFNTIASENNPNTEICVIPMENELGSYVLFYLDKVEGQVKGILYLQNEFNYIDFMGEVLELLFEFNLDLIQTDKKISLKIVQEVMNSVSEEPEEMSTEGQNRLVGIFEESFSVDKKEIYQIITGSTMTIH